MPRIDWGFCRVFCWSRPHWRKTRSKKGRLRDYPKQETFAKRLRPEIKGVVIKKKTE